MRRLLYILAALLLSAGAGAGAEELPRPVMQSYRIEYGSGSALSTYLSPLRYHGNSLSFSGRWEKASQWNPEKMTMHFEASATFRDMRNPAGTASMVGFDGQFSWGLSRRFQLPADIQLNLGGSLDFNGGILYLPRNGNNPAAALASGSADLNLGLYRRFKIGRLPILVADEVRLPSIGCFFSPEYGETYYEIYLGNHRNLAHCGWWGNNFCIDNLLSVKLDFGRTAMEVGYRYSLTSSLANSLNTQIRAHRFVIGVIPHGLGMKRANPKINSPYF